MTTLTDLTLSEDAADPLSAAFDDLDLKVSDVARYAMASHGGVHVLGGHGCFHVMLQGQCRLHMTEHSLPTQRFTAG